MPPKETSNPGMLYILDNDTGEYKKLCEATSITETIIDEPEVVMAADLARDRDYTIEFTIRNPVVADAEYKEVSCD